MVAFNRGVVSSTSTLTSNLHERSSPDFARSILEQLGSWRYEPATLDGKPVAVRISLRFSYRRLG